MYFPQLELNLNEMFDRSYKYQSLIILIHKETKETDMKTVNKWKTHTHPLKL